MALELIRNVGGVEHCDPVTGLGWDDEDAQLLFDPVYFRHVVVSSADVFGQGYETAVFPTDEKGLVDIATYARRAAEHDDDPRAGTYAWVEGRDHQGAIQAYNDQYSA